MQQLTDRQGCRPRATKKSKRLRKRRAQERGRGDDSDRPAIANTRRQPCSGAIQFVSGPAAAASRLYAIVIEVMTLARHACANTFDVERPAKREQSANREPVGKPQRHELVVGVRAAAVASVRISNAKAATVSAAGGRSGHPANRTRGHRAPCRPFRH